MLEKFPYSKLVVTVRHLSNDTWEVFASDNHGVQQFNATCANRDTLMKVLPIALDQRGL